MHVDIELPEPFDEEDGIARPYVVTIDKSSRTILSIRRNYYEDDKKKKKRQYFVHYKYLPGLASMVRVLFTSLVGLLKALQVFSVNLSMLVLYLIYQLVLKLGVYASKGMIRLSCRVSSVTLMYRVVQFVTLLLSFLTRNQVQSCTNYSKISLTRGEGLAPLQIYKLETSTRKRQ